MNTSRIPLGDSSFPSSASALDSDPSPDHPENSFFVEALYPFNGDSTSSLSFQKGDLIEVLTQLPSGWWDGVCWRQLQRGWFPSNYVRRITDEEARRIHVANATQPPSDSSILNILPSETHSTHSPKVNDSRAVRTKPHRLTFGPNSLHHTSFISQKIATCDPPSSQPKVECFSHPSNVSQRVSRASSAQNQISASSQSWTRRLPRVTADG